MQFLRTNSKRRPPRFRIPAVSLSCAATLFLWSAHAQNSAAPGPAHTQALPELPASPLATPPSTAAVAPSPATVNLTDGKLTVSAQNSDLTAILQQVARASGMSIEGLGKTTRVFGVYGPGNPRDVLTDLLDGSGYNFVMLGGGNGSAPAKLVLTEKPAGPPPPANASPADDEDTGDSDIDDADQEPLGPGAIPHPSPQFTDNTDPETRAQRNLERLQQMRQQMMQQQQQANPQ
jgi:hypothetical protein